jgi:plastocyanin
MLRTRPAALLAAGLLMLTLAACGGSTATNPPSAAAPSSPAASAPASPSEPASPSGPASPSAAAGVCGEAEGPGQVAASARNFAFNPATITVKAGEKVTWANGDPAPHSIVLDGGECESPSFGEGESTTLVFNVAGSYPFHCGIHPNMTGTITVS